MKKLFLLLILMFCLGLCLAQDTAYEEYNNYSEDEAEIIAYSPREIISLSRTTNLNAAIRALEVISLQFENKKIVNISTNNNPIGFPINQMYWKDALALLAKVNGFDLEERPGAYMVSDKVATTLTNASGETIGPGGTGEQEITPRTKQVRISSIFFKADKTLSRDIGIDWSSLMRGNVNANVNFSGADQVSDDIFNASISHNFQTGDVVIQVDALLRILEQYQKGSIVARPTVTVLSGKKGFIQVGQDFSVKSLDDAGNTTEQFFTTGIILDVTPKVMKSDGYEAINLEVMVEKSSAVPGNVSTVINKSLSTTSVFLFDGEETVIGGLFDTDNNMTRSGVPFLKDLPWWVFGLRYLFGYNSTTTITNEMIIILKAEIVDSLEDRMMEDQPLKEKLDDEKIKFDEAKKLFDIK
jgi:Flp pilus assembly secretin CpaC